MFCAYTRPRYQLSVYRTIGPLVFIFAQNIDCGYTLEPVLTCTCTHNLCFRAKLRKIMYTPVNPKLQELTSAQAFGLLSDPG